VDGSRLRRVAVDGSVGTLAGNAEKKMVDGVGTAASFHKPGAIAVDSSDDSAYVLDAYSVRRVSPAGVVVTIAGCGRQGGCDGIGAAAAFSGPRAIALDESRRMLFVGDEKCVRSVRLVDGMVSTVAGAVVGFSELRGIVLVDDGWSLLLADELKLRRLPLVRSDEVLPLLLAPDTFLEWPPGLPVLVLSYLFF
jgi:DNA-binding beta-propeller fold protein YncE